MVPTASSTLGRLLPHAPSWMLSPDRQTVRAGTLRLPGVLRNAQYAQVASGRALSSTVPRLALNTAARSRRPRVRPTPRVITPHALCSPVVVHGDWECDACRAVRRRRRCPYRHASRPSIMCRTAEWDLKIATAATLATNPDGSADAGQLCTAESLLQMHPREANVNPGVRGETLVGEAQGHVAGAARPCKGS